MALFQKHEPDLGELAGYILDAARGRGITVTRARLVKLLYLVDVERVRGRREPITGIAWTYEASGPSAAGLDATLRELETRAKDGASWGRSVARDSTHGDAWVAGTKMLVDGIVRDCAGLDLNALLDRVYFETGPMAGAERGKPLQLDRARDDRRARRGRPLDADAFAVSDDDLSDRLQRWRAANRERFARLDGR
jgi:hypothetical protein